ncbi:hypothetical protein ATCC90586_011560 [Pythium insidiosum]|nr:hypothetical protein ATCC90586_011560 [Pythium insidiosum]
MVFSPLRLFTAVALTSVAIQHQAAAAPFAANPVTDLPEEAAVDETHMAFGAMPNGPVAGTYVPTKIDVPTRAELAVDA